MMELSFVVSLILIATVLSMVSVECELQLWVSGGCDFVGSEMG